MKVVVDTNVFVSSFLNPTGGPRKIIDLWKTGELVLCLCAEIIEEYVQVLLRFGLEGEPELGELLELFRKKVNISFTTIDPAIRIVAADPDDDKFIACAVASLARAIVSGDRHLRNMKRYKRISILSPPEFLRLWEGRN